MARTHIMVPHGGRQVEAIVEGAGPVLVMLPSLGRDAEDFDEVAGDIATAGYRVVRPQPRGIGRTPLGDPGGLTLHDLAGDVAAVIAAEAAGPVVVAGHAFGGFVARMLAADRPDLVRGLILVAVGSKQLPPDARPLPVRASDPTLPEAERLAALETGFFAPGHDARPWLAGWYPATLKLQRAATEATDQKEWWPKRVMPILELQGALDPFRPRPTAYQLRDELGDCVSVVEIADARHALVPEQPERVIHEITAWLKRIGG